MPNVEITENAGRIIIEAREKKHFCQNALADNAKLSVKTIRNLENGSRTSFSFRCFSPFHHEPTLWEAVSLPIRQNLRF